MTPSPDPILTVIFKLDSFCRGTRALNGYDERCSREAAGYLSTTLLLGFQLMETVAYNSVWFDSSAGG